MESMVIPVLLFWYIIIVQYPLKKQPIILEAEHCLSTINFYLLQLLVVVDVTGCVSDMVTHTHTHMMS